MGATLAHLYVLDVNITKKRNCLASCSIDFSLADPIDKANRVFPFSEIATKWKWDFDTDSWFRVVWIPLIMQPVCFAVNTNNPPKSEDGLLLRMKPFKLNYPKRIGDMINTPGSHCSLDSPFVLFSEKQMETESEESEQSIQPSEPEGVMETKDSKKEALYVVVSADYCVPKESIIACYTLQDFMTPEEVEEAKLVLKNENEKEKEKEEENDEGREENSEEVTVNSK